MKSEIGVATAITLCILAGMLSGCAVTALDSGPRNGKNSESGPKIGPQSSNTEDNLEILAKPPEGEHYVELQGWSPIMVRAITLGVIDPPDKGEEVRVFVPLRKGATVGTCLIEQLEKSRGHGDGLLKRWTAVSLIRNGKKVKGRAGWGVKTLARQLDWPVENKDTIRIDFAAF